MTNSTGLELILCSTLVAALAVGVWRKLYSFEKVSVLDVAVWMTALFFGLGPWMAFSYGGWDISRERTGVLLGAYGGVWLFIAGLHMTRVFASYRRYADGRLVPVAESYMGLVYESLAQVNPLIVAACYVLVLLLRLVLALRYGILFSGTSSYERVTAIPYLLFSAGMVLRVVAMGCLVWATCAVWRKETGPALLFRYLPIAVIGAESIHAYLQGRRWMLEVAVLFFLGAAITSKKIRLRLIVGGATGAILLAMWAFPSFLSVRTRYRGRTGDAVIDLRKAIQSPIPTNFPEAYRVNMAQRPLIIRFNCNILAAQRWHDFMWGEAFLSTLLWAVPKVFYPEKGETLQPEQRVQHHYGMTLRDTSINWPATGAADFGVVGGLLAGLLFGGVLLAVERGAVRARNRMPFASACVIGGMLDVAIMVEQDPAFLWTHVRSMIIILAIAVVFSPGAIHRRQMDLRTSAG